MNELNEKLAEWAGFRYGKYDFVSSLSSELNTTAEGWISPEATSEPYKSKHFSEDVPNFTESLDACFKYLLPQLTWFIVKFEHIEVSRDYYVTLTDFHLAQPSSKYKAVDKNPALALCLAIEKLIDGEK